MSRDTIWYVTATIAACTAFLVIGAVAIFDRYQVGAVDVACIHAHGEMRDGVCRFGGGR